jgi:PKD repeat protein
MKTSTLHILKPRFVAAIVASLVAVFAVLAFAQSASPPPGKPAGLPRFFIYQSPQGVADDSGEPSIGSNWTRETITHNHNVDGTTNNIPNGGTSLYFGGFSSAMAKITWDDCSSPAGALWENKTLLSASTPRGFGDPILFTDHTTGRTFVAQLEGLTPAGATIDITDDDGDTFTPTDGVVPSDIDHETIGGGSYHEPNSISHSYQHAFYYGSQSIAEARILRSDDGGMLFTGNQPAKPMYNVSDCAGLHGHIKVAPDGTIYVPNVGCGGAVPFHETGAHQAVIVAEDNGATWSIRPIPDSTSHGNGSADNTFLQTRDPSVAVANDSKTIYFGYQGADGHARIAVSHDKGLTWAPSVDVGANVLNGGPVLNGTFPVVVAGDPDRAAFTFYGTETGGENWACGQGNDCSADGLGLVNARPAFTGVWYLYVATTFDGGKTWTTQNITPGDPVQRGGICGGGTCRNLLDFYDATIDKEGRVLVGFEDGCVSPQCIAGDPTNPGAKNDFTAKGVIARQTGGMRMFAAFDPSEPAKAGAPLISGFGTPSGKAQLKWPTPDNGGSTITGYNIYRSHSGGPFTQIATVPVTNYVDNNFASGDTYRVTAVNGVGEGPYCSELTPTLVIPPNPCATPGVLAINDLNADGSDNDSGANTPPDPRVNVRQLFIAEPDLGKDSSGHTIEKLIITMQLAPSSDTSVPPSSQWYIVWNRQSTIGSDASDPNDSHFDRMWVGMKSDASGALSFQYGKFGVPLNTGIPPVPQDPNANTPVTYGNADKGTYDVANGVVTIEISNSKLRAMDGATNYSANTALVGLNVRTYLARPDAGQKSQNNASDITSDNIYNIVGNASCYVNKLPIASLSASPTQGTAPLKVSFNGSGSNDPDGSVVSYTFAFGDGTPLVTQSSPNVQHTYTHGGAYFATLTVQDNSGDNSANTASVPITVQDPPPTVNISVSTPEVKEGGTATYTISLSSSVYQALTVNYSMSGTATNGSDYNLSGSPGQVTIPGGATSGAVTLTAIQDNIKEKPETAIMTLQPGSGYKLPQASPTPGGKKKGKKNGPPPASPASATLTIHD